MTGRAGRSRGGPVVVLGDTLLDRDIDGAATRLVPDAPAPVVEVGTDRSRPGGAALAASLAARDGREVVLVTALGDGPASETVRRLLPDRVRLVELPLAGDVPTKTRILAQGRAVARLDSGGGTAGDPDTGVLGAVLGDAAAILVSDYGRGAVDVARPVLARLTGTVPVVWDPHPRGGPPEPGVRLATPNAGEAEAAARTLAAGLVGAGDGLPAQIRRASALVGHWRAATVAITLGARGAVLSRGADSPIFLPAPFEASGDACGAGDCFASAAMLALGDQALPEEAVRYAVACASEFVACGGVADPHLWEPPGERLAGGGDDAAGLARAVRERGGTVVATGGCFDLLHAGHVELLQAARRLGDCLIVCLNSDASVRRLKGGGRPLNTVEDRARVLLGLECVDAVAVFEESTPISVLKGLRPHLWVKGGDYTPESLPERSVLRQWDGEAVVLPYVRNVSTTELARRAADAVQAARPGSR